MGTWGRIDCKENKDFLPSTSSMSSTACVLVNKMITKITEILAIGWQKLMKRRTSLLEGKHKTKQKQAKISKPSTVKHLTLATNNLRSDSNVILEWHLHLVNEFGFSQTVFLVFFLLLEKVMSTVIYTSRQVFFKFILTNYLTINVHKSWTSGLLPKEEILLSSLELGSIRKESFSQIKPWTSTSLLFGN